MGRGGDTLQHMMEGISGARSTLAALGRCWPDGPSQCSSITSGGKRRLDKGCCCSYISPCTSSPHRCAAAAVGHWLCPPAPSPLKGGGIGSLSETWVGIPGAPWPSLGLSTAGKSPDCQVYMVWSLTTMLLFPLELPASPLPHPGPAGPRSWWCCWWGRVYIFGSLVYDKVIAILWIKRIIQKSSARVFS